MNTNTNTYAAKAFGISFLIGYLSYGLGFGLLNVILNSPEGLLAVFNSQYTVIVEAGVMMAIFAPINIVLAIIMVPIFKPFNQVITYGYLSTAIASTLLLIVGAIFLLVLVPLSQEFVKAGTGAGSYFDVLSVLCKKANFYSYQLAMVVWGIGGFMFSYLLYISKIVPQWLSIWGLIGYVIFVSGAFFAIFGVPIDVILDIPGGLFEIFLSLWLIIKGFDFSTSPHKG